MIGDLGSQVERTGSGDHDRRPSLNSGGAVNGKSSQAEASVDMDVIYANGHRPETCAETLRDSHSNLTRTNSVVGAVGADKDGHLIVKDRFWTIFCKEVSLKPAKHPSLLDRSDVTLAPQIILN